MVTPQILEYIRSQLAAGTDPADVRIALLNQSWSNDDITAAFTQLTAAAPAPQKPPPSSPTILPAATPAPSRNKGWVIAILIIVILLSTGTAGVVVFGSYMADRAVSFQSMQREDLYVPPGYDVLKVDEMSDRNQIYTTTYENQATKTKIILMRYKGRINGCSGQQKQAGSITYCLIDGDGQKGFIKKGVIWMDRGLKYDLTTSDGDISFDELLNVAEPFARLTTVPAKTE